MSCACPIRGDHKGRSYSQKREDNIVEAILSGIIQGITEFLPISSSGHLVILHRLIEFKGPQLLFDIFLHIGTLISIFFVFWKDILELFSKRKLCLCIFLATIITVLIALAFVDRIEAGFKDLRFVGRMLLITGAWLFLGNLFEKSIKTKKPNSLWMSAVIGLSQGIAGFPGISRSGATISTGLMLGLDRKEAVRFSFLLSIPAILLAFIYKINSSEIVFREISALSLFLGLITSCIIGILSLKLLLKLIYKGKLYWFGVYCIILGIVVTA